MTSRRLGSSALLSLVAALAACSGSSSGSNYCSNDDNCDVGKICVHGACVAGSRQTTGGDPVRTDEDATDNTQVSGDNGDAVGGDGDGFSDEAPAPVDFDPPDTVGPIITINQPAPYQLEGAGLNIEVQVSDVAGVDASSVTATLGDELILHLYQLGEVSDGIYGSSTPIPESWSNRMHITIEVSAQDRLGNVSTVGHEFSLDTQPPILSLTSAGMTMTRVIEGITQCSHPFEELGSTVVRHGDIINPVSDPFGVLFFPRVRIEDMGNGFNTGEAPIPISGIDDSSTTVYLLASESIAVGRKLLTTKTNGYCEINPEVEPDPVAPSAYEAVVQTLWPVRSGGVPDFTWGGGALGCANGTEEDPPVDVCYETGARAGLTYWLGATFAKVPAIYVLNWYDAGIGLFCPGGSFDSRNLPEGPVCLAARARDRQGNEATSAAIAICIENTPGTTCAGFDADAVVCSDGCQTRSFMPNQRRQYD